MVRTGHEGGLRRVLDDLARAWADDYSDREIASLVGVFCDGLAGDRLHEAADEYIHKYGHLLPAELTEGGGWRVKADFPKYLAQHVRTLLQLRDTVRVSH